MTPSEITLCASVEGPIEQGATVTFKCVEPNPQGRFVKVRLQGEGFVTLCEVVVHGRPGTFGDNIYFNTLT